MRILCDDSIVIQISYQTNIFLGTFTKCHLYIFIMLLSTFRPSSPRRSRLCLVSWAGWRWFYAQQPGPSDTLANMDLNRLGLGHDLLLGPYILICAPKLCDPVAQQLYHGLHCFCIFKDYFGRCPGTIRPKCSSTISEKCLQKFLKMWRVALVLTWTNIEGVLK